MEQAGKNDTGSSFWQDHIVIKANAQAIKYSFHPEIMVTYFIIKHGFVPPQLQSLHTHTHLTVSQLKDATKTK